MSIRQWLLDLEPLNIVDGTLRLGSLFVVSIWLYFHGMVYQQPYDMKLVELNLFPWWNILLVAAVAAAAIWCPRVGILAALAVFLYLSDMEILGNSSKDGQFMADIEEQLVNATAAD